VQGFPAQQPEHNTCAVHNHTPVPTSRLDARRDLTNMVIDMTHWDIASHDLPNVGRARTVALSRQAIGEPIQLAGNVIKNPCKAQAFKPPRGPRAEVSLQVIAVNNNGLILLERCGCLAIELLQWDINCPR
jgi:hypothetical protein